MAHYLGMFFFSPINTHAGALQWWLTGLAAVVFLPLYFLGYWFTGARCL